MEEKIPFREMLKINWRGLRLVYSFTPITMLFTAAFIVMGIISSYWGIFSLARLIDDLILKAPEKTMLFDFFLLTAGQMIVNIVFVSMLADMGGGEQLS